MITCTNCPKNIQTLKGQVTVESSRYNLNQPHAFYFCDQIGSVNVYCKMCYNNRVLEEIKRRGCFSYEEALKVCEGAVVSKYEMKKRQEKKNLNISELEFSNNIKIKVEPQINKLSVSAFQIFSSLPTAWTKTLQKEQISQNNLKALLTKTISSAISQLYSSFFDKFNNSLQTIIQKNSSQIKILTKSFESSTAMLRESKVFEDGDIEVTFASTIQIIEKKNKEVKGLQQLKNKVKGLKDKSNVKLQAKQ